MRDIAPNCSEARDAVFLRRYAVVATSSEFDKMKKRMKKCRESGDRDALQTRYTNFDSPRSSESKYNNNSKDSKCNDSPLI